MEAFAIGICSADHIANILWGVSVRPVRGSQFPSCVTPQAAFHKLPSPDAWHPGFSFFNDSF
jgi:hypothetical protein